MAQPPGAVAECGASLDYMMDVLPLSWMDEIESMWGNESRFMFNP
jgi:hypothetical protein